MRKKIVITASLILAFLFCIIGVFMLQNTKKATVPKTGLLYYDDSEHDNTLYYDFSTGKVREVQVDGYENITNYRPLPNGFYCLSSVVSGNGGEDQTYFVYDIGRGVKRIRLPNVYAPNLQFDGKTVYYIAENFIESAGLQHVLYALNTETGQAAELAEDVTNIFLCANRLLYLQNGTVFMYDGQSSQKLVDTRYVVKQDENSFLFVKNDAVGVYSLTDGTVMETDYDTAYFPFLCSVGNDVFLRTNLKQSYIEKRLTEPETAYSIWPDKFDFVHYYLTDATGGKTELKFLRHVEISAPYFVTGE